MARKKFARGGLRDILFFILKSENWNKTTQEIHIYFNYKMLLPPLQEAFFGVSLSSVLMVNTGWQVKQVWVWMDRAKGGGVSISLGSNIPLN